MLGQMENIQAPNKKKRWVRIFLLFHIKKLLERPGNNKTKKKQKQITLLQ
jgi:hypothetical protein